MSLRTWTAAGTGYLLAMTLFGGAVTRANAQEDGPRRFSQLLKVGETVLLKSSTEFPLYSLQLLSQVQTNEIHAARAKYDELQKASNVIGDRLETEKNLGVRAKLYLNRLSIDAESQKSSHLARLAAIAYEVQDVAADFVALKKSDRVKFVPIRSIREMQRYEKLAAPLRPTRVRRSKDEESRTSVFRLRHADASEVIAVVSEHLPEANRKLQVQGNQIVVTSNYESVRRVEHLIKVLDVKIAESE